MDRKKRMPGPSCNQVDQSEGTRCGTGSTSLSRRQFLFAGAGLAVGAESLSSLVDELTSLLNFEKAETHPQRGESLPRDLVPPASKAHPTSPALHKGQVFLTFDDGPLHCTGKILDLLAATRHKATFFVIGRNLKDPKLRPFAVRALREGHDIGNHSFSHPDFSTISAKRAEKEIVTTHELIQEVMKEAQIDSSRQDLFFRFPYGVSGSWANYAATQNVLASLEYRIAFWDLDTHDWRMELAWFPTSPQKVLKTLKRARPRDVILLHDRQKTAHCLTHVVEALDSRQLVSVPLSDYWGAREHVRYARQTPSERQPYDSGALHDPDAILGDVLEPPLSRATVRHDASREEPLASYDSLLW
jgi:peptidoglycan-N-acetylglucosamine deacetylase